MLPIISFVVLAGRCRLCRAPISCRYPLVELLTAGLCAAVGYVNALNPYDLWQCVLILVLQQLFTCCLIALAGIDLDRHPIPDALVRPVFLAVLAVSPFVPAMHEGAVRAYLQLWPEGTAAAAAFLSSLSGALLGAGLTFALSRFLIPLSRPTADKPDAGARPQTNAAALGYAKLMGLTGALLGPKDVLLALLLATLVGAASFPLLQRYCGQKGTPLAPALSAGSLIALLARSRILGFFQESL